MKNRSVSPEELTLGPVLDRIKARLGLDIGSPWHPCLCPHCGRLAGFKAGPLDAAHGDDRTVQWRCDSCGHCHWAEHTADWAGAPIAAVYWDEPEAAVTVKLESRDPDTDPTVDHIALNPGAPGPQRCGRCGRELPQHRLGCPHGWEPEL